MALLMFILAFVVGYPLFMILAYILAKVIFSRIDTQEEEIKKERVLQTTSVRRLRIKKPQLQPQQQRLLHA